MSDEIRELHEKIHRVEQELHTEVVNGVRVEATLSVLVKGVQRAMDDIKRVQEETSERLYKALQSLPCSAHGEQMAVLKSDNRHIASEAANMAVDRITKDMDRRDERIAERAKNAVIKHMDEQSDRLLKKSNLKVASAIGGLAAFISTLVAALYDWIASTGTGRP